MAFVNVATGSADTAATTIASAAASHTAGNMLAVHVVSGDSAQNVSSIADTAGNTYTLVASSRIQDAAIGTVETWVAANIAGNASNVVTATYTASVSFRRIIVTQFSGRATTAPAEIGTTAALSASPITSPSFSPAASGNDNSACAADGTATYSAGVNYTIRVSSLGGDTGSETRDNAPAGAQTAAMSFTGGGSAIMSVASFKVAGGAAQIPPTRLALCGVGQ